MTIGMKALSQTFLPLTFKYENVTMYISKNEKRG